MSTTHYDVIIIGGRCAGASLALRLAEHNLTILLVDRANFPSSPNVPSAPFIHPSAMRLLDEMGIDENEYTHEGSRIDYFAVEVVNACHAVLPISQVNLDRNYFRGIDRHLFDNALWQRAKQAIGVTARDGFAVSHIQKDQNGVVCGISGKSAQGTEEIFTADLVVGADGRFSFCARQFGAKVIEEQNQHTTAVYLAEWEGVAEYSADYPNTITSYRTGKGFMVLVIPIAQNKYHIGTIRKSADARFGEQGFEHAYMQDMQRIPNLHTRLKQARRVSDVAGMRPIENGYRQALGANWALVGDAVHYKDPSDGQGIYDALLGAKLLAESIIQWKKSGSTWASAGASYEQRLRDATYTTFKQTVANVKQSIYTDVPDVVNKTLVRWLLNAPEFQSELLRYLSRAIDAKDYRPIPRNIMGIIARGIRADIRHYFTQTH
jgi:flavin-dependent dehydrogenase